MREATADRDARIVSLRAEGLTLADVAKEVGVTRERVRQLLLKRGGPTADEVRAATRLRASEARARLAARIRSDLEQYRASTASDVATRLGVDESDVRASIPADLRPQLLVRARNDATRWSRDAVLEALREASSYAFPLRSGDYERLLQTGEVSGPSAARVCQVFGNFGEACRVAGVEAARRPNRDYQSRWSDADILAFVRDYLGSPGCTGSFAGYDTWRKRECVDAPSSGLMRQRLGAWTQVKARVVSG